MKRLSFLILAAALPLAAQTKVSLRTQVRDFDLSGASSSRPMPVVSSLPLACTVGEMVFRSDTAEDGNIYACTSTGVWRLQSSGDGAAAAPFQTTRTSATDLTLGANCKTSAPCVTRVGALVYRRMAPATLRVTAGQGQAFIYVDEAGELTVGANSGAMTLDCTGCRVETAITGFPVTSIPLWTWTATSPLNGGAGLWDSNGGVDQRALLSAARRFVPDPNVTITESGSVVTIGASNPGLPAAAVTGNTSLRLGGAVPTSTTEALWGLGNELMGGQAAGTYFGVNASAGFTGDLAHWQVGNQSRFRWWPDGTFWAARDGQRVTWWGNAGTAAESDFRLALGASTGATMRLGAATRDFLLASAAGKISLGTTAPAVSSADLLIRDATATTGNTQVQIQAGEGQARDLLQFVDSAGNATTRVTAEAALVLQPTGTKPTCGAARRGTFWFTAGGTGEADVLEICRKTSDGTYSWLSLP